MSGIIFNSHSISPYLGVFGLLGTAFLLVVIGRVLWQYRGSRASSFQWHMRNWRLKQIFAIACLFFLAMAASYWVIQEALGWIYLLVAFKMGTWWFGRVLNQRA